MTPAQLATITRMLATGATVPQLVKATGFTRQTIASYVNAMHDASPKAASIIGWELDSLGRAKTAVWMLGAAEDVPRPVAMSAAEKMRKLRAVSAQAAARLEDRRRRERANKQRWREKNAEHVREYRRQQHLAEVERRIAERLAQGLPAVWRPGPAPKDGPKIRAARAPRRNDGRQVRTEWVGGVPRWPLPMKEENAACDS